MTPMTYTRDALLTWLDTGAQVTYHPFYGHRPSYDGRITDACLSQWWRCSFEVDGLTYGCTEQYMMAEKARLFGDHEIAQQIMRTSDPKTCKALGRRVRGFNTATWAVHKYDIVRRGNLAKFTQNPDLGDYLVSTGSAVLIEASPWDRVWGVGLEKTDPAVRNPRQWRGQNLLGFALMEVRDFLSSADALAEFARSAPVQDAPINKTPMDYDSAECLEI